MTYTQSWASRNLIERGQYNEAISILDKLVAMKPKEPEWNYYIAFCLQSLNKHELLKSALHHYNIALENGFSEFWVRYNRGIIFRQLGNLQDACNDLQRAASINSEHEGAQKVLTELQEAARSSELPQQIAMIQELISNSKHQIAITELEVLLQKFPSNAQLNYQYGFCLQMMRKEPYRALHHYNLALQNGFEEFWVKYNRGSLLFSLGEVQAAKADLESAVKLKPDHNDAQKVLQNIIRAASGPRFLYRYLRKLTTARKRFDFEIKE